MEDIERVEARLHNIRTVEPVLGALRTISLASWQMALQRRGALRRYEGALNEIFKCLGQVQDQNWPQQERADDGAGHDVALVIGSERGLCGRFNKVLIERVEAYLSEHAASERPVELICLGTRISRVLSRRGHRLTGQESLSLTKLPPYRRAQDMTRNWLNRYTAGEIEAVDVLYNTYQGAGAYTPEVKRVIPPDLPPGTQGDTEELWPPPIIDTNPARLREQVGQQWTTVTLYRLLIDSATAEHSARYQIMENATQNTQRLIEELTLAVQNARKQAITQEMQELAAGAGLISPD